MNADETLMKEVRIPMQIKQWADQATDPETRALYMAFLDFYMEQRQQEMMAQQQQALMPSGGAPGSGAPPPLPPGTPPGSPAIGPGGNTLNMAGLGAPPGSAGQPVGRPPGPFGPPGV